MIPDLLRKYPLISDQVDAREVMIVLEQLEKAVANTDKGDVVEFGCYAGTTSLFMSRFLYIQKIPRELYVYDSFEGLPEKKAEDQSRAGDQFVPGELSVSKKQFILNYKKAGLALPHVKKAWFSDLSDDDLPDKIAFAFLDGDYYESVLTPLKIISSRLVPGAIIVVDDYANEALPGAAKAVDEWINIHPVISKRVEHSLVILKT